MQEFCQNNNLKVSKSSLWKLEQLDFGVAPIKKNSDDFLDESLYNFSAISVEQDINPQKEEESKRFPSGSWPKSCRSNGSGRRKSIRSLENKRLTPRVFKMSHENVSWD